MNLTFGAKELCGLVHPWMTDPTIVTAVAEKCIDEAGWWCTAVWSWLVIDVVVFYRRRRSPYEAVGITHVLVGHLSQAWTRKIGIPIVKNPIGRSVRILIRVLPVAIGLVGTGGSLIKFYPFVLWNILHEAVRLFSRQTKGVVWKQ
eukprot:scaffold6655_cov169-Amphora_coffeaeformis.AAC.8